MSLFIDKAWKPLTAAEADALPGQLGVYELGNDAGETVFIGYAGGRSLMGLRGEVGAMAAANSYGATKFRVEVNMQYLSRWKELLMVHRARDGALPPGNALKPPQKLGRIHLT
jgi:hypothetical protein